MQRWYYNPKTDNGNTDKEQRLDKCFADKEPFVSAYTITQHSVRHCVLTGFGEIPDVITVQWCREFAAIAAEMTGENIGYVGVEKEEKKAKYWVEQNRLRLYDKDGPFYENNNGVICRDRVALMDS